MNIKRVNKVLAMREVTFDSWNGVAKMREMPLNSLLNNWLNALSDYNELPPQVIQGVLRELFEGDAILVLPDAEVGEFRIQGQQELTDAFFTGEFRRGRKRVTPLKGAPICDPIMFDSEGNPVKRRHSANRDKANEDENN